MRRDNLIDVRMGYKFEDGWITNQPAIVIKIAEKKTEKTTFRRCGYTS